MKKILSLILAIALIMAMAMVPAMAEGETEATEYKYQVRGIRDGDVIVANEETSRVISIVTAATADKASSKPTVPGAGVLDRVEFYDGNDNPLGTVTKYPWEFTLKFDSLGNHTLKTKVCYTDDTEQAVYETFKSEYSVVLGTVKTGTFDASTIEDNPYSYEENFDTAPSDGDDAAFNYKDIEALPWVYDCPSGLTPTCSDGKLTLSGSSAGHTVLNPFAQSTGTKVTYYRMNIEVTGTSRFYCYLAGGTTSDRVELYRFSDDGDGLIELIIDQNSRYVIIKVDGKENRRYDFSSVKELYDGARLTIYSKSFTLDNVTCTSYDIKEPQTFSEATIQGGENNPVPVDLAQIRVKGNDYLAGQDLTGVVTVDNDADFTPSIDGKDIVITFNEDLAIGTTYTLTIDGVKDSDKLPYEKYTLTFRTLREGENPPPQAELKSPVDGARYYPGDTITLSATATDSLGGSISYMEFYCDGELIEGSHTETGVDDVFTYEWSVDDTLESFEPHIITALACDNEGATVTTPSVKITVLSKQTPTVSITAPENEQSYASNFGGVKTDIKPTIKFDAADSDGEIALIEIFIDGDRVFSGTGISQFIPETPLSAGSHSASIYVTDNDGLSAYDEIELTVEEYGYTSYILRENLSNTNLHSKYDKVGTVKSGNLSSFEDVKGIVILSDKPETEKESSLKRTCIYSLEGKPFSVDIKIAFGDTKSERKVMLDTFELYTFSKGGSYIPGEVYTVTALVDYDNLRLYTLVDGKAVGTAQTIKSTTFTTNEVVTVTHTGGIGEYSETALLGIEISNLGETTALPETKVFDSDSKMIDTSIPVVADTPAYITASFVGTDVDISTLANNLLLINEDTGERVALEYQNGRFNLCEKLKYGADYTLMLLPAVRDVNGKGYCGAYKTQFSTKAPEDAVGVESVSAENGALNAGIYTATLTVDFNGVGEVGESVNVICTAYNGNKMIYYLPTVVNVGTALADVNIPIEISGMDANTVIEVFVVDTLTDLKPISDRIFVINQN